MTDYAGVTAYGDFELSYSSGAYQTSEQRRYLDGECHETTGGSPAQTYWHGDLIASTFATSDSGGALTDTMAYTAFGERVNLGAGAPPASFPRYEYAGSFGYESGMVSLSGVNTNLPTMTLQHLGQRWYDPSLGRFVQRDPSGRFGDLSVYRYAANNPILGVDLVGSRRWIVTRGWPHKGVVIGPVRGKYYYLDFLPVQGDWFTTGYIGISREWVCPSELWSVVPWSRDTTPEEDELALAYYQEQARHPPRYNFFLYNCVTFAEEVFHWNPPEPPAEPPQPEFCFTGDVVVYTPAGNLIPIGELCPGDIVAGMDPEVAETATATVMSVRSRELEVESTTLCCTSEHPFWTVDRGWLAAGQLQVGDLLLSRTGRPVRVTGLTKLHLASPRQVFNLEVTTPHTFRVGPLGILAHNKPP